MRDIDLQHPVITNMERTGYPDGKEPEYPRCPICGEECDTVYRNKDYEIVGCGGCITTQDAWGQEDCFPDSVNEN